MAGCAAGAAATVVTYPMETLRTHMALGGQSYRQCLADVLQAHGHRGLYKGFTSGVVSLPSHSANAQCSCACISRVLKGSPLLDSPGAILYSMQDLGERCHDTRLVPTLQADPLGKSVRA